ncbi:hypothetical protein WMY93_021841 [Mugilogobius chulae]|uniref:AF4/FMR2 family member lilli n=1 Tax=Mugilogobius chulae TaxID=88201 RepID=A0AAW0NPA2_9GOBI
MPGSSADGHVSPQTENRTHISKTLTDHFNNSSQSAPDPSAFIKRKPASVSPNLTASVPQDIGQVALSYVNITTLFLNAHDVWEQADEFVKKGSGLSAELDKVMGRLSLSSTMSFMVCYIRQGLHWLQMNSPKVESGGVSGVKWSQVESGGVRWSQVESGGTVELVLYVGSKVLTGLVSLDLMVL